MFLVLIHRPFDTWKTLYSYVAWFANYFIVDIPECVMTTVVVIYLIDCHHHVSNFYQKLELNLKNLENVNWNSSVDEYNASTNNDDCSCYSCLNPNILYYYQSLQNKISVHISSFQMWLQIQFFWAFVTVWFVTFCIVSPDYYCPESFVWDKASNAGIILIRIGFIIFIGIRYNNTCFELKELLSDKMNQLMVLRADTLSLGDDSIATENHDHDQSTKFDKNIPNRDEESINEDDRSTGLEKLSEKRKNYTNGENDNLNLATSIKLQFKYDTMKRLNALMNHDGLELTLFNLVVTKENFVAFVVGFGVSKWVCDVLTLLDDIDD